VRHNDGRLQLAGQHVVPVPHAEHRGLVLQGGLEEESLAAARSAAARRLLRTQQILPAVLWNRNYILQFRFRFRHLISYGSGSDFCKVMVPVPTFEKLWFRFRLLKSYGSGSGF
jgi:hypothetical protein